jgi:hypothetical protein
MLTDRLWTECSKLTLLFNQYTSRPIVAEHSTSGMTGLLGRLNVLGLLETCVQLFPVIFDKDVVPVEELSSFVYNPVELVRLALDSLINLELNAGDDTCLSEFTQMPTDRWVLHVQYNSVISLIRSTHDNDNCVISTAVRS